MRQLNPAQAAFLEADTHHSNANLSLLHIFDQATAPGGRVRFKAVLAQIEHRLQRAPLFRQRLQPVPLGLDRPYWIDDVHFDVEYHVRHIALPKPGDWRQFCIQVSRLHARPLDLGRPLWEAYVIEGLDSFRELPVGSFALLLKTHRAALDLDRIAELSELLLDDVAVPAAPAPAEPWLARPAPGPLELAGHSAWKSARSPVRLARPVWGWVRGTVPAALALAGDLLMRPSALPVTRFGAVVSPHRVFETRRFDEADFTRIARRVRGATLDDVALAICGDALRRYLALQHELPATGELIARVAVADQRAGGGTLRQLSLGATQDEPLQRIRTIRAQRLQPAGDAALAAACTAGERAPPAHCSIGLLPSPARPQYLCGARMRYYSAMLPIRDGIGLSFAVTRHDGRVAISPTSCREQLPDPVRLAQCLRQSFQSLLALAKPATRPAVKAATARGSGSGTSRPKRRSA